MRSQGANFPPRKHLLLEFAKPALIDEVIHTQGWGERENTPTKSTFLTSGTHLVGLTLDA